MKDLYYISTKTEMAIQSQYLLSMQYLWDKYLTKHSQESDHECSHPVIFKQFTDTVLVAMESHIEKLEILTKELPIEERPPCVELNREWRQEIDKKHAQREAILGEGD